MLWTLPHSGQLGLYWLMLHKQQAPARFGFFLFFCYFTANLRAQKTQKSLLIQGLQIQNVIDQIQKW